MNRKNNVVSGLENVIIGLETELKEKKSELETEKATRSKFEESFKKLSKEVYEAREELRKEKSKGESLKKFLGIIRDLINHEIPPLSAMLALPLLLAGGALMCYLALSRS
jgi:predicted  nucleic acid-binding Zn-ribbon protein